MMAFCGGCKGNAAMCAKGVMAMNPILAIGTHQFSKTK